MVFPNDKKGQNDKAPDYRIVMRRMTAKRSNRSLSMISLEPENKLHQKLTQLLM